MKNLVTLGSGNSRFMKSIANFLSVYPTYESFAQALIDGTFPFDLNGLNPAGISDAGTPLNKATLLTDATATLLGLSGDDPTVDNALTALCNRKNLEFGTYTGTDTYGEDNPNTLSFDLIVPKVLFICADKPYSNNGWIVCDVGGFHDDSSTGYLTSSVSGNTVTWYNTSSAQRQLNLSSRTYYYVAIGEIGA